VVRGRLVAINGEAVQKRVSKDSQGEAATQRELSLTWAETLPEDNAIIAGGQWQAGQSGLVSVEQKLAENLQIHVGDQLAFTVGSAQLTASVASIRSLQWDTMKPNFYMIFSPATLDGFPATYMTSFFLPESQKSFLNELIKKYPAVSILEVDQLLKQFQTILKQLTLAIDMLLYGALLAGLTVLFAAVYSTLDNRIYEGALMRALGADRKRLRKTHVIEFAVLGATAGVLATAIVQAILYVLYRWVMHIEFQADVWNWIMLPIVSAFAVGVSGYWGVREVVNQSPMRVLRR
jgi:putative ABC transport system permease protein